MIMELRCSPSRPGAREAARGFTIVEILLALAIFSMVITAVYASWTAILRSARVGRDAATDLQRTRLAARTFEDALVSAVMFTAHPSLYAFEAETSGDFAAVSFVSRLPPTFPGNGYFGDQIVRRVTFAVENSADGVPQLVLRQIPILQTNVTLMDQHAIILARDISTFMLEFCQQRANGYEWRSEWDATNQLPKLVRFALAFGKLEATGKPREAVVRSASLPCSAVPRDSQRSGTVSGAGVAGQARSAASASEATFGSRFGSPIRTGSATAK